MAKSERRGWKKYFPMSLATVSVVFFSLVAIKLIEAAVGKYVPPAIQPYMPTVA